jgi:hypothetical protein
VVAAAACFLFAGFAIFDLLAGDGGVQRGVRIGDVNVGGMSKEEARAAVQKNAAETFKEISFGEGPDAVSMSARELGVEVNAEAAVEEAYALGRTGGPFARLSDTVGASFGGTQIDLKAGYDEEAAQAAVGSVAEKFNREPKDATFTVTEGGDVEVQEAQNGRALDQEATLANLEGALENMSGRVPWSRGRPEARDHDRRDPEEQAREGHRGVQDGLSLGLEPEPQGEHEARRGRRGQHGRQARRGLLFQRACRGARLQGGQDLL